MKKMRLSNGLIAYKVTRAELYELGGVGVCDSCNALRSEGYLVPVLNRWMCLQCFDKWKARCVAYPEDACIEAKNCEYYESKIVITDWPSDCDDGKCTERDPTDGTPPCDAVFYEEFFN